MHTQKNNRALVVDNFLFYNDGKDLWRCAHRYKDKCKKTCRIVNGKVTTNTDIKHSHPPLDDHDIKMYEINHAVKEKAVERPDDKPFLVLTSVLHDMNSEKLNMTDFAHLRRNACRAKHIVHYDVPKSKEKCLNELRKLAEDNHELIKSVEDDIVLVARDKDLQLIPRQYVELYADGTFQYAPRYFKQKYSFFVFKDGFYIPIAHFLVKNKTKSTYKKCIEMLVSACQAVGVNLKESLVGGSIMMDFEISMINAIKEILDCDITGCRFHLGQSWMKNIGKKGLAVSYMTKESDDGKWLRGLFGLSLVPALIVKDVFKKYCRTRRGKSSSPKNFKDYIWNTYAKNGATFEVEMWAGLAGRTTNNGPEAFHRHFGDLFGYLKSEPGIWHFIRNMNNYNLHKDIKLRSVKQTKKELYDTNDIIRQYISKEIGVTKLLQKLSMKNRPKCKLRRA